MDNGFEAEGVLTLRYDDFDAKIIYSKIRDDKTTSLIVGERGTLEIDKMNFPKNLIYSSKTGKIITESREITSNMIYEIISFEERVRIGDFSETELDMSERLISFIY